MSKPAFKWEAVEDPDDGAMSEGFVEGVEAAVHAETHCPPEERARETVTTADLDLLERKRLKLEEIRVSQEARATNVKTHRRIRQNWTSDETRTLVELVGSHNTGMVAIMGSCTNKMMLMLLADWTTILREGWAVFEGNGRTVNDLKDHYKVLLKNKQRLALVAAKRVAVAGHLPSAVGGSQRVG